MSLKIEDQRLNEKKLKTTLVSMFSLEFKDYILKVCLIKKILKSLSFFFRSNKKKVFFVFYFY